MWREGGGLEKLSGGHGRGGGEEEEEEEKKGERTEVEENVEKGAEEGVIVEVVQSAFIERAYRNC